MRARSQPRFEVLRELGSGGEGRVLAVVDRARGGATLALKETHGPRAAALRDEFELLSRLRHPCLVPVYDYFATSPVGERAVAAYTQAWVEGRELGAMVKELSDSAKESIMIGVLGALAHLHAAGIAHLDLKPENLLVDASGAPFLVDFGIATRIGTRLDVVRGSRSYVAPELVAGAPVAASMDLWAFGKILSELAIVPELSAWLAGEERPTSALEVAARWSLVRREAIELFPKASAAALVRSGGRVGARLEAGSGVVVVGPEGAGRRTAVTAMARAAGGELWPLAEPTLASFVDTLARLVPSELPDVPAFSDAQAIDTWAAATADSIIRSGRAGVLGVLEPRPMRAVQAVLERLVRHAESGGVGLTVAWARDAWEGLARVELPPFDRTTTRAFVQSRFGAGPAADEALVGALAAASGGRPGQLEALCELLVARGALVFGQAGWTLERPEAARELPPDLGRALADRVALLDAPQSDVLAALGALRFPSTVAVVAAASGLGTATTGARLRELEAAGLVHFGADGRFAPAHPALRSHARSWDDAARARVLAEAEVDHRARALLEGGVAGARRLAAIALGALHDAPEAAEEAAELALMLAPDDVEALSARATVANLLGPREVQRAALERLLRHVAPDDARALEARSELFWTLTRMADVAAVLSEGPELVTRARAAKRPKLAAEVLVHLAITAAQRGDQDASERWLHDAAELAKALPEALALRARIANNLGNVHAYRQRHDQALEAYGEARRIKVLEGDPVGERIATGNLGLTLVQLGRHADAREQLLDSWALAKKTGHRRGEAWSLLTLAELGLEGAAWSYTRRLADQAAAIAEQLGDGLVAGDAFTTAAEARLQLGDASGAAERAERGQARAEAAQNGLTAARARLVRAIAVDDREAIRAAVDDTSADAGTRRTAARLVGEELLQRGQLAEAERVIRKALDDGPRTDLRWLALAELDARVRALTGSPRVDGLTIQRFESFLASWPAVPAPDPDGPCQATVRSDRAVRALASRMRGADRGIARGVALSTRLVKATEAADSALETCASLETTDELEQLVAALLTRVVQATGAERGFLVVFSASGESSRILTSRDADGESIADAARRLPDAAVAAAWAGGLDGALGKPWRASDGRGSVAGIRWRVPLCGGHQDGALVLQNRFVATAFEDTALLLESLRPLLGPIRVLALEVALGETKKALALARADANVTLARATDEIRTLRRELETTREQLGPSHAYPEIVFKSAAMKKMLRQVDRVLSTDLPIHIHGESGTGKELVARAIHHLGPRARGPFVAQNCTAIPPTLFESELFGHERGAFTGAHRSSEGLFRRAHGGTLFLDEIGDLPMELQAKLLRVLETGEFRSVGGTKSQTVDVRIVSATHRDLAECITKGTFREDLYYRLNVIRIDVPPLRERPDDVLVLIDHFLARRAVASRGEQSTLTDEALKACLRYPWPGNVRQLENEITRAALLADSGTIQLSDLSPEVRLGADAPMRGAAHPQPAAVAAQPKVDPLEALGLEKGELKDRIATLETIVLKDALERARHNKSEVARDLGLSRAGLNLKLKRLGLWAGDDE